MNRLATAGRRGRASAALLAALTLVLAGCADPTEVSDAPAASVVEETPLIEQEHTGASESTDETDAGVAAEALELDDLDDPGVVAAGSALELLGTLPVKGRAPKTGYDRKAMFGSPWQDVDRNGCDTRNDMLQRDLTNLTLAGPCKVLAGTLADKYTGKTIEFVRGNTTSTLVQIDHVVALSDAWQKGAQQLSQEARVAFANDPINLIAADGPANSAKSDSDAASWLPKNRGFRCEYIARQVSTKAAYNLWITAAERDAMQRVLTTCPDEPAVVSTLASKVVTAQDPDPDQLAATTPEPGPTEQRPAVPTPEPAPETYYKNCTAAREAGGAPVYEGQPGYGRHLDRDGDGVGCE